MSTHRKNKRPAEPRTGNRAAIYARRSAADEGRSKSVDQQIQIGQIACQGANLDCPPERVYREADGQKGDWTFEDDDGRNVGPFRPQLTRLVRDIEAGQIDALVVYRTDRYYRSVGVASDLLNIMRRNGVRLLVKGYDYQIHTAAGFERAQAEAVTNESYRNKISEDILRDKI